MAHAQKLRFRLSAKRASPFKSAGASVQSTTGSRGVRISGSNAGYTMFRGSVKGTVYPLHSPVSPFTSPPLRRHRVTSHFNWTLPRGFITETVTLYQHNLFLCRASLNKQPLHSYYNTDSDAANGSKLCSL